MENKFNEMSKSKVYIAGPITNDPDYKIKFDAVNIWLTAMGCKVFNPTSAPLGLTYKEYIDLGLEMLMHCDCMCVLPHKENNSSGVELEKHYAKSVNMPIIELKQDLLDWLVSKLLN